jgi:hypothetical protein
MRRNLRILNIVFWLALWTGVMVWTNVLGAWAAMLLEGVIPFMLGMFIHIALRDNPESSTTFRS